MKMELKAQERDIIGRKVNQKRKDGLVPAVVYGSKNKPMNVWLNSNEIQRMYDDVGETTIIQLLLDSSKAKNVLIHDIQFDPIDQSILHVDLFEVDMKKIVDANVELHFTGESPAVKEEGGVLVRGLDELPIRCLPVDLPSEIVINISTLKTFDDTIRVKDIIPNDRIETHIDENTVVASVSAPRLQEEPVTTEVESEESSGDEKKSEEAATAENKEESSK